MKLTAREQLKKVKPSMVMVRVVVRYCPDWITSTLMALPVTQVMEVAPAPCCDTMLMVRPVVIPDSGPYTS